MANDTTARPILVVPTIYDIQRFWSRVTFSDGCWEWNGHTTGNSSDPDEGYGSIRIDNHHVKTHRLSWLIHYGQIPFGLLVLHKCDNTRCVRPDHLFLGDALANSRDMVDKGRACSGERNIMRRQPELLQGEKHGNARLTDDDIRTIRREFVFVGPGKRNPTARLLADHFGVTAQTIYTIAKRKSWTHVLDEDAA